jgi:hypothetical protein
MGTITNSVIGNGYIAIFVNGDLTGRAEPGQPVNVTVKNLDIVTWYCAGYGNNQFVKLCDVPQTECTTTASTIKQINIWSEPMTMSIVATFSPISPPDPKYGCFGNSGCLPSATGTQTLAECQATCEGTKPPTDPNENLILAVLALAAGYLIIKGNK